MSRSLYVHVPFCVVKCGYCDFNSYVVEDHEAHDRFLDALAAELAQRWPRGERPISVFVGGGTPSLLSVDRLRRLFAIISERVDLDAAARDLHVADEPVVVPDLKRELVRD